MPIASRLPWNISPQVYESRHVKTCLRSFRQGPTQTGMYSHKLEILEDSTIYVAKTKALISCVVTAQLICVLKNNLFSNVCITQVFS